MGERDRGNGDCHVLRDRTRTSIDREWVRRKNVNEAQFERELECVSRRAGVRGSGACSDRFASESEPILTEHLPAP